MNESRYQWLRENYLNQRAVFGCSATTYYGASELDQAVDAAMMDAGLVKFKAQVSDAVREALERGV